MKLAALFILATLLVGASRWFADALPFWQWAGAGLTYGLSMHYGGRFLTLLGERPRKYRLRAPWERV